MTTVRPITYTSNNLDDFLTPAEHNRTPWLLAFFCLLVATVPSYVLAEGPLKILGSPARVLATALLLLVILGFLLMRRGMAPTAFHPGVIIILTYGMLTTIAWGIGVSHLGSAEVEANKGRVLITVLANVGIALYATTRIKTERQRSFILGALGIGLIFNCVVGLLQNTTAIDLHLLFKPPGFVDNQIDLGNGLGVSLEERHGAKRAFGTSGHAIEFSVLAAAAVPLTAHFARYATTKTVRVLAAVATGVALISLPAGVSRSGVVALAAAFLVYMWSFTLRQLCTALALFVLAVLGALAAVPNTMQALWQTITNSAEDTSVLVRIERYAKVSQTFHDHPIFGIGVGATPTVEYGPLDNQWLQILVQGGLVGLVAFLLLAVGGIFGIAGGLRRATSPSERDQAYAMGAMFSAILASSFTFDLFGFQQATFVFFLLFGLLWSNFAVPFQRFSASPVEPNSPSAGGALP